MRLKKIEYKILMYHGEKLVTGYAMELPPPLQNFRCCLRRTGHRAWSCDHYDSGRAVGYAGATLAVAVKSITEKLLLRAEDKTLVRLIKNVGLVDLANTINRDIENSRLKAILARCGRAARPHG